MAQHKSAIKRARQTIKRNARNRALRSALRTAIKKFDAQIQAKEMEAAEKALPLVHKTIDRAVTKGVLHRNTAARRKSRVAAALKRLQAA